MISDLKPYAEYKESGLRWLGKVPRHWEMRPSFGAFVPIHKRNRGMREKTVLSLSYGRIIVKPPQKLHGLVPESFETYQIVNPGDIILRTTDLQNDHTSLRVGIVRDRGIITSAYLALRTHIGVHSEFGFQILNVWDTTKAIYGYGSGLRQNLDFSHFKRMFVAVPPPKEQDAIVRFLNWANGRLDQAIRAKRKAIALLTEQKQAMIHRAVTCGLDNSVEHKSSGIPWLSSIPKHWEMIPNRAFLKLRKHLVGKRSKDFVLLSLTMRGIIARDMNDPKGKWPSSFDTYQEVCPGDLVFCLFDIDETPRFIGHSALHGMITGAYTVFTCNAPEIGEWIYQFYLAMDFDKRLKPVYTGLRKVIQKSTFLGVKTPIPPSEERRKILGVIRSSTAEISRVISRLEREIVLLREYRARLVADVVTGKLDVRQAAARLPKEVMPAAASDLADEPELVDEEANA